MRVTAYFFAGLERAGPIVTAIQFGTSDVTTLARPCQSIKPQPPDASTAPFEASRTAPEVPTEAIFGTFPCKNAKVAYITFIRLAAVPC